MGSAHDSPIDLGDAAEEDALVALSPVKLRLSGHGHRCMAAAAALRLVIFPQGKQAL